MLPVYLHLDISWFQPLWTMDRQIFFLTLMLSTNTYSCTRNYARAGRQGEGVDSEIEKMTASPQVQGRETLFLFRRGLKIASGNESFQVPSISLLPGLLLLKDLRAFSE